jgi:uncharacterized membrane protein (DUF485 family)
MKQYIFEHKENANISITIDAHNFTEAMETLITFVRYIGHGYILVPFFTAWIYSRCYASAVACGWLVSKLFFLFF